MANPNTMNHHLAQNRYFEDEAFIGYVKYLQYWQRPEYIKFIMYPHCLFFLELLQNPAFHNAMAHPANKDLIYMFVITITKWHIGSNLTSGRTLETAG
ncbi:Mediator of RNA polymerase II transcription subunit 31 [Capsicum chinense]|nr:Mediator of RNA polymerase II transcription subunit 31 [Capsicum chinense]